MKKILLLLFIAKLTIATSFAQGFIETQKVIVDAPSFLANFGYDVAISGGFAIVGAKGETIESSFMGAAYVLKKGNNGNWNQHQRILSGDRRQFDSFAVSVDIDGDYMVIGASGQDYDINNANFINAAGAAYVYKKDVNDNWVFVQKIIASDRTQIANFGISVAIHASRIVVGAGRDDYDVDGNNFLDQAGSAYIFEEDTNGSWNQVAKVTATERGDTDRFGYAVAIYGDYVSVGAYLEDEDENETNTVTSAGSVYVYHRDNSGVWTFQQKLVPTIRPTSAEELGNSLDMTDTTIVAGAPKTDSPITGAVYIFKRDGNDNWSEVDKLIPSDGANQGDRFGFDVALHNDRILVGSYLDDVTNNGVINTHGSIYYFLKDSNTDEWTQQQKVLASNWQDPITHNFGISVALDGDDAIVGNSISNEVDPNTNDSFTEAGSAYILMFDEDFILSINKPDVVTLIKTYPNPTKNILNLDFRNYFDAVEVNVHNVLGQHLFSEKYRNTKTIQLNINQPKGMYLVEVKIDQESTSVIKVIKQ